MEEEPARKWGRNNVAAYFSDNVRTLTSCGRFKKKKRIARTFYIFNSVTCEAERGRIDIDERNVGVFCARVSEKYSHAKGSVFHIWNFDSRRFLPLRFLSFIGNTLLRVLSAILLNMDLKAATFRTSRTFSSTFRRRANRQSP